MKEVEMHNGVQICQDPQTEKFILCIDTPDGQIRSNQEFSCIESSKKHIDSMGKQK